MAYNTPLIINDLGGGHTDRHTHTDKKPGTHAPHLNSASKFHFLITLSDDDDRDVTLNPRTKIESVTKFGMIL